MNLYHRDFTAAPDATRKVSFSLDGHVFECVPDVSFGAMEEYRAGFVPNEEDPTKVSIPVELSKQFVEGCLPSDEDVAEFRKICASMPFGDGAEQIHAIRIYLIESYTEAGPTTEPSGSSGGPPVSGPTSTADSGSPAGIPTTSPSAAT